METTLINPEISTIFAVMQNLAGLPETAAPVWADVSTSYDSLEAAKTPLADEEEDEDEDEDAAVEDDDDEDEDDDLDDEDDDLEDEDDDLEDDDDDLDEEDEDDDVEDDDPKPLRVKSRL